MARKVSDFPSVGSIAGKFLAVFGSTGNGEKVSYEAFTTFIRSIFYNKSEVDSRVASSFAGTVNSLTFDPGTPLTNLIYRANAGAGTYTHFLSAASTPIVVSATDGQVDFIFSTTSGFWTKVSSPQDLTNYPTNTAFNPVKDLVTSISYSPQKSDNRTLIQAKSLVSDGTFISSVNQLSLNYQPILPDTIYTLSGYGGLGNIALPRVVIKNGSGTVVQVVAAGSQDTITFTTVSDAATIAIYIAAGTNVGISPSTSTYLTTLMLNVGTTALAFLEYGAFAFNRAGLNLPTGTDVAATVAAAIDTVSSIIPVKNLIDKTKIVAGSYYSPSANAIASSVSYRRTNHIPVEEGQQYTLSGYQPSAIVAFFANTGTSAVGRITPFAATFTIPSGIHYVIINVTDAGSGDLTYDDTIQLEKGAVATAYAAYAERRAVRPLNLELPYAIESEVVKKQDLLNVGSFNLIDIAAVNFSKRYSTGSKRMINADSELIAASAYIPVTQGELYTISGSGIYGGWQGGYFSAPGNIDAVNNITFFDPVSGTGKVFQVPTALGITHVVISLSTNGGHTALTGNAQMEKGELASAYQPYAVKTAIKPELLPATQSESVSTGNFDSKAWFEYTQGEVRTDISDKIPVFKGHWLKKDKDLVVANTGTSLSARSSEHCTTHVKASERPPLMHSNNLVSILWDKMRWDNQFYRRYDYAGFFTEEPGAFITSSNLANWDDGAYRAGFTRCHNTDGFTGLVLTAKIPAGAWQYNFIYRTDNLGCTQVRVNIAEGNNEVQVFDETDHTWKEANAFVFSMLEATPVARVVAVPKPSDDTVVNRTISTKSNTTYQKRLKMRCKGGSVDSLATEKTITLTKVATGRFMYWGVEWSLREFMITYINGARGSHNTQAETPSGLPRFADNEIWGFKPDLMFFELPIHNDGASGASPYPAGYWGRLTNDFVFKATYELSMVTRSTFLNGFAPELVMFNPSISWGFNGINDDGTLKLGAQNDGTMMTALDKYNQAYLWVLVNHPEAGFINSVRRWVEAGFAIFGDLKTATLGSGKGGTTFTNEGSHWNDTGSKIIAKTLTGVFEFV